ncbi:glycosyltransferase [Kineococcus sp. R8]|uniref:glycosyltransferase n=1 Tax=Kineococcus siccus TaxID=2696567 RepID=UPI001412E664|nr:glycosyltransferase family A protein [Kineococcus siccus]NAZ83832.1 glycosyltransferase [Kineococcus siccus]
MSGTSAGGLTVVIPARDAAGTIGRQLEAVVAGAESVEVVVADNGSTDGTQQVVRDFARRHPRTVLLDASATPGPSFARNQGIAAASHELVGLCDADDVVAPGWARAVEAGLQRHDFVGGPLDFELLNPSWVCDARGRERTRQFWTLEDVGGPAWPHVTTSNLGIRRSAHEAIGGFDEDLQWSEDNDYSFRLRLQLGLAPEWVEDALVNYRYRTRLRDLQAQANHYSQGLAGLVSRYGEYWQHVPRRQGPAERALKAGVRLAMVRNRGDLARWHWHLGAAKGYAVASQLDVLGSAMPW